MSIETFFYITLFILGTLFGSFSSVLITRWKNKKDGIILWRSACPKCNHTLWWSELIPILSWIFQSWKCKNCSQKIPKIYPILELSMWIIFVLMWFAYLQFDKNFENISFLIILLILGFFTWVYIFYDILYMEIPDEIFFYWILLQIILFILVLFFGFDKIFFNSLYYKNFYDLVFNNFLWAIWLYSFLFLQILLPWWYFLIKNKKYKDFFDLIKLFFIFPIIVIIDFIKYKILKKENNEHQNEEDDELWIPTWIWTGDLFLAIIIWWTLWLKHWIVSFFLAYIIWSIVWIIILLITKNKEKSNMQIAFGPFLGIGFIITIIFYWNIDQYINNYLFLLNL